MKYAAPLVALVMIGCGGDSPTSPTSTSNMTQARVWSNDGVSITINGVNTVIPYTTEAHRLFDAGPGRQCATAELRFGRNPPSANVSFLTLCVGQNKQTTKAVGPITVCGTGPALSMQECQ